MSRTLDPYPSWETFRELIAAQRPAILSIQGTPSLDLFVGDGARIVGLRVPWDGGALEPSPLEGIETQVLQVAGAPTVEVSTSISRIYEEFFSLAISLAQALHAGEELGPALSTRLDNWRELLRPVELLSDEEQLGLWGELWVLERLLARGGVQMLDSWTGPRGEPHDFRMGTTEIEVKTTSAVRRAHMINGLMQLVPSVGHYLYLLSLQVEPAGANAGMSLDNLMTSVRAELGGDQHRLNAFSDAVTHIGYRNDRAEFYRRTIALRTEPVLVPVKPPLPALTASTMADLGSEYTVRVKEVHYRLDIEGLGWTFGEPQFREVLPIDDADVQK